MRTLAFSIIIILLSLTISKAQPTIVVKNKNSPDEVLRQAHYYADLFGFDEDVLIVISFSHRVSRAHSGYTLYQYAQQIGGGHQVHIFISKREDREYQYYTLAHEMVHARQFIEGSLVQCGDTLFSWKGQECQNARFISHNNRPWEKEAHSMGTQLYTSYLENSRLLAAH